MEKVHKKTNYLLILGIVFLCLIFFKLGTYYKSSTNPSLNISNEISPTQKPLPTKESQPTEITTTQPPKVSSITIPYSPRSDWQTYTDDVAKFSFQYNNNPTPPYNARQTIGKNEAGKSVMIMGCNTPLNEKEVCLAQFTITIYSNYNGGSRREWLKNNYNANYPNDPNCPTDPTYYSDILMAGKNALLLTSNCSSWGGTTILIPNGSQMIVLSALHYSRDDSTGKIIIPDWINTILSTFKFL